MLSIWFFTILFAGLIVLGSWGCFSTLLKSGKFTKPEAWIIAFGVTPWAFHLFAHVSVPLASIALLALLVWYLCKGATLFKSLIKAYPWQALALPAVYFFIKTLDGFVILPHGDPISYHLRGPLVWFQSGHIVFPKAVSISSICNIVEMYFTAALQWISWFGPLLHMNDFLAQRMTVHILGQQLSLWLGFASMLILFGWLYTTYLGTYAQTLFTRWKWWLPTLVFIAAVAPQVEWLTVLAKNNWLASCYVMATLFFFSPDPKYKIRPIFAGATFALGYWAKATNLLTLLPLALVTVLYLLQRKRMKELLHFLFAALLTSAPFLIRNFLWTTNPFYPSDIGPFHSSWVAVSERFDIHKFFDPFHKPTVDFFQSLWSQAILPVLHARTPRNAIASFFGATGVLGAMAIFFSHIANRTKILIYAGLVSGLLWMSCTMGRQFFEPHIQPYILLLRLMSVATFVLVLDGICRNTRAHKQHAAVFVLFILGLFSVDLPFHILWKDFWPAASGKRSVQDQIYSLPHGTAYQCMNEKLPFDSRIVSDWLNTTYYVRSSVPTIGNHAPLEKKIRELSSFQDRLLLLKKEGYTHVWLNNPCPNEQSWPNCSALGAYSKDIPPENIICQLSDSVVLKL